MVIVIVVLVIVNSIDDTVVIVLITVLIIVRWCSDLGNLGGRVIFIIEYIYIYITYTYIIDSLLPYCNLGGRGRGGKGRARGGVGTL